MCVVGIRSFHASLALAKIYEKLYMVDFLNERDRLLEEEEEEEANSTEGIVTIWHIVQTEYYFNTGLILY